MGRFVKPEVVRLELSGNDWIETKKRLSYGEQQRLVAAGLTSIRGQQAGEPEVGLDLSRYDLMKIETWLVDWSF